MTKGKNRKARRAERASRGGSQGTRAGEETKEILAVLGAADQAKNSDTPLRARAREVDFTNRRERVRFCATIGPHEFERKTTALMLAEEWGLEYSTVRRDLSDAWGRIEDNADPSVDHAVWYRTVYDLIAGAEKDEALVADCIECFRVDEPGSKIHGKVVLDAIGLKMVSDALKNARETKLRAVEQLGKASGLIQSGSKTEVTVTIGDAKVKATPSETAEYLERAFTFFREKHPELLVEFDSYVRGVEVVEMPATAKG